jgi:uncharacterized membrane protein YbhN (UPF0104 family)
MGATGDGRGRARRRIERGVLLLAAVFALWALRHTHPRAIVPRLGPGGWGGILALFAVSTTLTFLPSWLFLRLTGARVPFLGLSAVMLSSQAVNATNPLRMGFPMRVYLLKERYDVPVATASLLIPLEGFVAIAVAVLAAVAAAPLQAPALGTARGAFLALGALVGVAMAIGAGRLAARRPEAILSRLPVRARRLAEPLLAAVSHVRPWALASFAICFLLVDLTVAAMLGVALRASGFEAPILFLLGVYCAAYLVGTLSLIPQGLGSRDAALGFLLHAGGATADQAASAVLIARVATTGLAFLVGILCAFCLGLSRRAAGAGPRKPAPFGARR